MKNILIVGGGLAGLTTAYHLSKTNKFNITILEKEKNVGGRVLSISHEQKHYDFGGFLILPWYKEFLKLCKDFNLESELKTFRIFKEYYYDSKTHQLSSNPVLLPSFKEYINYLRLLLPLIILRKLNFYHPNYNLFGKKSVREVLNEKLGENNTFYKVNNDLVQSYTYNDLSTIPMSIFAPMIIKMFRGYFNKAKVFVGKTSKLIEEISQYLISKNVRVINECSVSEISSGIVTSSKGEFPYDVLVIASTLNSPNLHTNFKVQYSDYSCLLVKMTKTVLVENSDNWTVVYLPHESEIVSIFNPKSVSETYDSRYLILYAKKEPNKDVILNQLKKVFPNNSLQEIVSTKHWEALMPCVDDNLLLHLNKIQGENNTFYAGDYFSWPIMESAVYSGKYVANLINKNYL